MMVGLEVKMGMVERAGWRWASGEGDRRRHAARRQRQRRCHRASTEAAGRRKIEAVAIEEMVGVELVASEAAGGVEVLTTKAAIERGGAAAR